MGFRGRALAEILGFEAFSLTNVAFFIYFNLTQYCVTFTCIYSKQFDLLVLLSVSECPCFIYSVSWKNYAHLIINQHRPHATHPSDVCGMDSTVSFYV